MRSEKEPAKERLMNAVRAEALVENDWHGRGYSAIVLDQKYMLEEHIWRSIGSMIKVNHHNSWKRITITSKANNHHAIDSSANHGLL